MSVEPALSRMPTASVVCRAHGPGKRPTWLPLHRRAFDDAQDLLPVDRHLALTDAGNPFLGREPADGLWWGAYCNPGPDWWNRQPPQVVEGGGNPMSIRLTRAAVAAMAAALLLTSIASVAFATDGRGIRAAAQDAPAGGGGSTTGAVCLLEAAASDEVYRTTGATVVPT